MLVGGRRRDIGLGGYPTVTLAQARDKARLIEAGRKGMLFTEAVDKALAAKLDAFPTAAEPLSRIST